MLKLTIKSVPIVVEPQSVLQKMLLDEIKKKAVFLPIVTFNFTMIGAHSKPLFDWLKQRALFIPDGIGISILLFFRYCCWVSRYPGIELVQDLLNNAVGLKIALVGATESSLQGTIKYINNMYPSHTICFTQNGFVSMTDEALDMIRNEAPDLILVAKGCPQQEQFILDLSSRLNFGVAVGVGGSFDVWSGQKRRAPKWIQYFGCEWLYRVIQEPHRIGRLLAGLIRLAGFRTN